MVFGSNDGEKSSFFFKCRSKTIKIVLEVEVFTSAYVTIRSEFLYETLMEIFFWDQKLIHIRINDAKIMIWFELINSFLLNQVNSNLGCIPVQVHSNFGSRNLTRNIRLQLTTKSNSNFSLMLGCKYKKFENYFLNRNN